MNTKSWMVAALAGVVFAGCASQETATREEAERAAREAMQGQSAGPETAPVVDAAPRAGSKPPVNAECPVMGGPVDPARTVIFEEQKVAFCCGDCVVAWLGYSDDERRAKLQAAIDADEG